jgi:hypothetical protein
MVTIVFFAFIAFGILAAVLIAMQSKRRKDGKVERPQVASSDAPKIGRATGGGDD